MLNEETQAFAARLAKARAEAGHSSPRDAAEANGWNENTYKSRENAIRGTPSQADVRRYARAFRVSFIWLLTGEGSQDPGPQTSAETPPLVYVPLIDEVTAGKLGRPSSQIPVEKVPLLAFADLGSGEFFATRVSGTSMDRVSPEGSIIIVNRRDQVLVSGKCYVFSIKGETTYKRWQGGDPFYLEPYSTDLVHRPIFVKRKRDLEVIGRVKRTVLDL